MKAPKKSTPATKTAANPSENITVEIPKNKAAGGAAGAVVGGIVGGPVGAVVGGVVGASLAGNTGKVKKAISKGVATAQKSDLGKRVTKAVNQAGKKLADVYEQAKAKVKTFTSKKAAPVVKKAKTTAKAVKKTAVKAVKKAASAKKKR